MGVDRGGSPSHSEIQNQDQMEANKLRPIAYKVSDTDLSLTAAHRASIETPDTNPWAVSSILPGPPTAGTRYINPTGREILEAEAEEEYREKKNA